MLNRSLIFGILAFGIILTASPANAQLPPELRDRLTHATVYIETQLTMASRDWAVAPKEGQDQISQRPSEPASGSGFLITEDGYIVTNAHVIEGITILVQFDGKNYRSQMVGNDTRPRPFNPETPQEPFTVQFNASSIKVVVDSGMDSEKIYTPTVVRMDKEIDLALLKISGTEEFVPLALAPEYSVESGTRAIMTGFPGGLAPDVSPFIKESNAFELKNKHPKMSLNLGSISAVREYGKEKRYQLAIGANHGNSGGPISNPEGDVIGVLYAGIDQMQNINYAIPISYLSKVCTTDLKQRLELPDDGEEDSSEAEEEGGDQSFDDFLGDGNFDFGDKKPKK